MGKSSELKSCLVNPGLNKFSAFLHYGNFQNLLNLQHWVIACSISQRYATVLPLPIPEYLRVIGANVEWVLTVSVDYEF